MLLENTEILYICILQVFSSILHSMVLSEFTLLKDTSVDFNLFLIHFHISFSTCNAQCLWITLYTLYLCNTCLAYMCIHACTCNFLIVALHRSRSIVKRKGKRPSFLSDWKVKESTFLYWTKYVKFSFKRPL